MRATDPERAPLAAAAPLSTHPEPEAVHLRASPSETPLANILPECGVSSPVCAGCVRGECLCIPGAAEAGSEVAAAERNAWE